MRAFIAKHEWALAFGLIATGYALCMAVVLYILIGGK